jgi:hypothetical protein
MPSRRPFALAFATLLAAAPPPLAAQGRSIAERLGYPANAKLLILHADDLGVAHSVNAASLDALERGAISSASIMMPTPWVTEVAAWARAHPDADLGLHLTLNAEWETYRWGPVAPKERVPSLFDSSGTLPRETETVAQRAALAEVERELRAQVELALAHGIRPTHLDSHMGALFTTPGLFATYARVARDYRLPFLAVRQQGAEAILASLTDRDVVLDTLVQAFPSVPPAQWKQFYLDAVRKLKPGLTEIIVHLGHDDAELRAVTVNHEPWGSAWRQRDYDVVTSPEFRQALRDNGVTLIRWRDLQKLVAPR